MSSKQPNIIDLIRGHEVFAPLRGQGLKALVFTGSVWTVVGFGSQKVLQLGSNLVLTRLLFPEAFGTMALITVFLMALAMFSDLGIKPAIIQNERGEDPNFLNTAWTIQVIRGFVIWLVACLIAWPLAQLYEQLILFPILCFVGVTAVIQGFQSTALATQNRKLQLGRLTLIPLIAQIISTIVTVLLAWIYESIWALAVGSIVSVVAETILSHLILPSHRHRFHFEGKSLSGLLRFGKWIFLSTMVGYFGGHGKCDAWLFASRSEGFGLPINEAMACCPLVIGTSAGVAPQYINDKTSALVEPNADAFAEQIIRFSKMRKEDWQRMSESAFDRVSNYVWQDAVMLFEANLKEKI